LLEILLRAVKDIFDKKIFLTSLVPIVLAAFFWGIVFFVFRNSIESFIVYIVGFIPFFGDSKWLQNLVEVVGLVFVYYELLILTSVMIVGLISDKIVDRLNDKYYQLDKRGFGSTMESIKISVKQNLLFIFLFILFLPLIFIPLLNIAVNLFLWMIVIKKPMFYDSVSMYATKEEYEKLYKSNKFGTFIVTLLSASLFLIPLLGVFVYILQLLVFAHYNLDRLRKIRG